MRPIKLTMSAFSSYSGVTVLEMDKLGKNGLYLITGETGAGKTTIFDAIIFALYGKPSGNNRKPEMLRSKYADPKADTWVELEFEYRNEKYTVKRNPPYRRLKKGSLVETTPISAGAALICPDGKVFSGVTEVDAEIKRIIGIDREQFSQIAMIAQGDFLKLLTATTETRQEIFRKIFGTRIYRDVQEKLREKYSEASTCLKEINQRIAEYISDAECGSESVFAERLSTAQNGGISPEEAKEIIRSIIADDTAAEKQLEEQLLHTENNISEAAVRLEKAESYQKAQKELAAASAEIQNAREMLQQLNNVLKEQQERQPEADKITMETAVLEEELKEYKKLDEERSKLNMLNSRIDSSKRNCSEYEISIKRLSDELNALNEELKSLENSGEQKERLEREKGEAQARKDMLIKLDGDILRLNRLEESYNQLSIAAIEALDAKNNLVGRYEKMYDAFFREQAGIIAETMLAESMPCPVCGSTTHPSPAKKSAEAPTEAELKKAEGKAKNAQENAEEIRRDTAAALGELTAAKELVISQLKAISENAGIEKAAEIVEEILDETDKSISSINKEILEENRRIERRNELSDTIPDLQQKIESLRNQVNQAKEQLAADEASKNAAEDNLRSISEKLKFENAAQAQNEINAGKRRIQEIRNALTQAESEHRKCENSISTLEGRIQELQKQLSEGCEITAETAISELNELKTKKSAILSRQKIISTRNTRNISTLTNLSGKLTLREEAEKEFQLINDLHRTANGLVKNQEKVMLETYVQMVYFDKIIHRANYRLNIMTSGQYELRRRAETSGKQSQSGLDLEIIDRYNNTVRDVKSLSGGESFKASLALALGLSDEIERSSGGIKLDAMFIDEGFGSLDDNSLQQAINALAHLTGETHLVGIISHVSELKRKIDKQIIVSKKKAGADIGTSAEIVC